MPVVRLTMRIIEVHVTLIMCVVTIFDRCLLMTSHHSALLGAQKKCLEGTYYDTLSKGSFGYIGTSSDLGFDRVTTCLLFFTTPKTIVQHGSK